MFLMCFLFPFLGLNIPWYENVKSIIVSFRMIQAMSNLNKYCNLYCQPKSRKVFTRLLESYLYRKTFLQVVLYGKLKKSNIWYYLSFLMDFYHESRNFPRRNKIDDFSLGMSFRNDFASYKRLLYGNPILS